MNGMQYINSQSSFRYPLLYFIISFSFSADVYSQTVLGSSNSIESYLSNVSAGRWDFSVPIPSYSSDQIELKDLSLVNYQSDTEVNFHCTHPLGCNLTELSATSCGTLSGWYMCEIFRNVTSYDNVNNLGLEFGDTNILNDQFVDPVSNEKINLDISILWWNTDVIDIGSPDFNISLCKSNPCFFQNQTIPFGGAFLSKHPATISQKRVLPSSNCTANYLTNILTCVNDTYPAITLGLVSTNVTGTSFNLMNYFAICTSSSCYSIQGYPMLAASSAISPLPLSTTITMAILLPISFLLMCAFFVILYKLCCESWRKM